MELSPAAARRGSARYPSGLNHIAFAGMFAFFPAGLVLYWLTNSVLSILQQWRINKVLAAD